MIKGGSEGFHAAIGYMMQPHDHWDNYSSVGFQNPSSSSIPMTETVENRCQSFERNELFEWVQHVTGQLIDDMPESSTGAETLQANTTATMVSGEDNFVPSTKALKRSYFDGEEIQWGTNSHEIGSQTNERELNMMKLLLECALAISMDNLGEAHRMLLELTQMASPYGTSCAERVVAYFAKAMVSRVINSWLGICSPLINHKSIHSAFHIFNSVSPFIKFAHFTSNQAILEAFHCRDRVHILDLDIMQGLQWPALFHILANRLEGPPHLRMTGFGASMDLLVETGRRLSNFARRLGMSFEFHPVAKKFGEIDIGEVQVWRGETVAMHWMQHSLYDASGPDWNTMRLLEQLAPRIITLVEQDVSQGGGSFLDRFVGSLHYFSTMFDSLGAYLPCDDPGRHQVEHCLLYREINNILAIGGPARSGQDKFRQWRSELAMRSCFVQVPISSNAMAQAQLILNMFPPAHGYSLVQGDGTLKLGCKDASLFTASAWTSHVSS